jgi:2-phospho-L-lactate/phosphoenolpyruvate guanylyltransferase
MTSSTWCLLPVKRLKHAKRRLECVLEAEERAGFARAMVLDVFAAAMRTRQLAGVAVITADMTIARLARREGFRVIVDDAEAGFRPAASAGARALRQSGVGGILVLPVDIPLATADDIDALLSEHDRGHERCGSAVTIVAAETDGGSNALACTPTDVIPFHYGPDSFRRHCRATYAAGIVPRVVVAPRLARDIDRPGDLAAFLAHESPTHSHAFIATVAAAKSVLRNHLVNDPREARP